MDKTVDGIIAPASPYRDVNDDDIDEGYLSDKPSALSEIKAQSQESFIGRHLPGQNYDDPVQAFRRSWDSEKRRKLAVEQGLYASEADLPASSGQPLLSPEEANARYGFMGPDGKPVKLTDEAVPDPVAKELGARRLEQIRRQSVMSRWQAAHHYETPLGQIPSAYGFAIDLLSPDTVAMSLVPGLGEEAILARLGSGFAARTGAKAVSGATTFMAGSGALMAADKMLPDWRGERADLSLREALHELYLSAAQGAIMHAAVNPAIATAWNQGKRVALQRLRERAELGETPPPPAGRPGEPPPAGGPAPKDIGDFKAALAEVLSEKSAPSHGYPPGHGYPVDTPDVIHLPDRSGSHDFAIGDHILLRDKDGVQLLKYPTRITDIQTDPVHGTFVQVEGSKSYYPISGAEKVDHAAGKPKKGDLTEALAQFEGSDGPTKRAAMDSATGQVLEGKPVDVRPHFDRETSDEVIQEQARQDRDGYAPGLDPATLAEETKKVYDPEPIDPEKFKKELGAGVFSTVDAWAEKAGQRARLIRDINLLEEGARHWAESGVTSSFPQGPLLAESLSRLRAFDAEIAAMPLPDLAALKETSGQDYHFPKGKTPALRDVIPLIPKTAQGGTDWEGFRRFLAEMYGKVFWKQLTGEERRLLPALIQREGLKPPGLPSAVESAAPAGPHTAAKEVQRLPLEGEILGPDRHEPLSGEVLGRGELPPGPVSDAIRKRDAAAADLDEWLHLQDEMPEEEAQRHYRKEMARIDGEFDEALLRHHMGAENVPEAIAGPGEPEGNLKPSTGYADIEGALPAGLGKFTFDTSPYAFPNGKTPKFSDVQEYFKKTATDKDIEKLISDRYGKNGWSSLTKDEKRDLYEYSASIVPRFRAYMKYLGSSRTKEEIVPSARIEGGGGDPGGAAEHGNLAPLPPRGEGPEEGGHSYMPSGFRFTLGKPRSPIIEAIQRRDQAARDLEQYIAHQDDMEPHEAEGLYRARMAEIDAQFNEDMLRYQRAGGADERSQRAGGGRTAAQVENTGLGAPVKQGEAHGESASRAESVYQERKKLPGSRPVSFKITGYTGRIFRDKPGENGLDGTYRFQVFPRGNSEEPIATMIVHEREPNRWEVDWVENHGQVKGIGPKLYDAVESHLGAPLTPSGKLSDEGLAFWQKRNPDLVRFHSRVENEEGVDFHYSPRKVRERLDYLADKPGHQAEREQLQKIWDTLPDEAKTPDRMEQMWSPSGWGEILGRLRDEKASLPEWLKAIPDEALRRPDYMASPEEVAKATRTPEQMQAEKEARARGMAPTSFRDIPAEEKPFDLTPEMEVKEDNRPPSERRASDLDYLRDKLHREGFYRISEAHRQETFRIADAAMRKLAPPGVKVYVVKEIKLADDGTPWVFYETSSGERSARPESLANPLSAFGFFEPSSKRVFLNRVTALGQSDHLLGGIVVHEVAHFSRLHGVFSPGGVLENSWFRILGHADRSKILDMSVGDYADLIGDPLKGSPTVSYRDLFDNLYPEGRGKQAKLDDESVALAIQLYDGMKARNDPRIAVFDPVKRDIEAFLSGEYQSRSMLPIDVLGHGDLLYGRAAGLAGNPRGREDFMLREPAWPLRADPVEARKADNLRDDIGNITNFKDYDWAIRELQDNRSLSPEEHRYLDELAKYTAGHIPGRTNLMVQTYYKLTGDRLNEPVSIKEFHEAYKEAAEKVAGTEAAARKAGKPFYVKDEPKFRSHLDMYGRENNADLGSKIPTQPKAWLIDKDADTVSLSPFVQPAYAEAMYAASAPGGPTLSAAGQMQDFAARAMRYFLTRAQPEILSLMQAHARELDAFGRKTTAEDALAFFRSYFTQPSAAQSLAPGFAKAIGELFDRIDQTAHSNFTARASDYEAGIKRTAGEPSEVQGLSQETAQQLAKLEGVLKTFDRHALLPEELGELDQTEKDLAAATTSEEKEAAARRRADAITNAIARKDIMDEVRANGGVANAKWALRSILHGTNAGSRLSVEAVWNGLRSGWLGVLDNQIRKAGLRKMAVSGSMDRETAREIWKMNAAQDSNVQPVTEGSPARRLAEILWPMVRTAKDRMNQAGARIGDALDYVLSTNHDPYKLRAAAGSMRDAFDDAFQAWWKFVLPRLNHEKTFADLAPEEGETIEQARKRFGRSVFEALATGVHLTYRGEEAHPQESGSYTPPAFEGSFNLAKRASHQRVLFWKDADSWVDYHQRFGPANSLTHAVINHLERSARNVALMDRMGTNPTANLNLIIRKIEEEYRPTDPDGVVNFRKNDVSGLQDVMAHLDGSANMPGNEMWATLNSSYRTWFSASALGGVGLTHFASIWPTVPAELRHHGVSRIEAIPMLVEKLASSLRGRGSEERQNMLSELGAFSDGVNRAMHRKWLPTGQDTVPGRISAIAATLMEYSGIHHIFDTTQAAVRETLAHNLGSNLGKEFGALDPHLSQMLGKYGIGAPEWDLIRSVPATMADGRPYLTPRDAHQVSDEALDAYTKAKSDEYRAKIEEQRQKFESADAREAEWHQARMGNLDTRISDLTKWIKGKWETRDAAFRNQLLLKLARVDELKNRIDTIEAATDLMQSLKGMGAQDRMQQFLEDVEGGAESWKAARAAGSTIERNARSNLSAGERLGEHREKIKARIADIMANLGGEEADAKNKADLEWLDRRVAELKQAVDEANERMHGRISARAERLNEMTEERLPQLIEELRRDARNQLSDNLLAYYTDAAKHSTIGGGIREKAALLGQTRPGTLQGEFWRNFALYKQWPLAQLYQGMGREYYMSLSQSERLWNIGVICGLSMLGGFMRLAVADAVSGAPQHDPLDPKTMAAALAQGGGLGVFGDYFFSELGRAGAHPLETFGGPAVSDVSALAHILYSWRDQALDETGHRNNTGFGDLAHWTVRHVPFANLIYLRGALNYLLWQHLYEAADPGWWDRTNRRIAKERGRTMMGYRPGAGVPFGVPPLYLQTPSGHTEGLLAGQH